MSCDVGAVGTPVPWVCAWACLRIEGSFIYSATLGAPQCHLCGTMRESADHILTSCVEAMPVIETAARQLALPLPPTDGERMKYLLGTSPLASIQSDSRTPPNVRGVSNLALQNSETKVTERRIYLTSYVQALNKLT